MAVGGFSERLAFILELDPNNALSGMRRVGDAADKELGKADDRLNRMGGRMQTFGAGAVLAAGVAGRALFGFAQAAEEANLAQVQLQNSIDNSPELAGASADAFNDLADAIQSKTAADGDQIVSAMAMLGTFHQTQDQIEDITPLVVDYARKFGVDLVTAATQVGKALDGNIGTLQRVGINIDEAAYASDRFSAVTDALRENVGGFAESEGATFAGQMERLKNQLGDVAEGIGGGVVGAVNKMIGPIREASEWFTNLDAGTQNTIGSFAAYGTAAVGVVGATSFIIGSVVKMVDNFKQAKEALDKFRGGIAQLGMVGGIVALGTAGAAALDHLEDSLNSARISLEDLSRASDEELVRSIDGGVAALNNFGQSADGLYASLAENGVGTLERYRDALEAAGRPTEDITAAIEAEAVAQANAAATRQAGTEAIEGATGATDGLTEATDENTTATDRNVEAQRARRDALAELTPNQLSVAEAMLNSADALDEYTAAMGDAELSDRDKQRAGLQLLDVYFAEGEAAGASAAAQATAAGNAAGAQEAGNRAQIESLSRLAQTLEPGSYLWNQVEEHIRHLRGIPTNISTQVTTTYTSRDQNGTAIPRFAGGGRPTPGDVAIVGEEGPELFVPDSAGTVIPAGETSRMLSAASGGGRSVVAGSGGPEVVEVRVALHLDGQHIDDALVRLRRNNGTLGFEQL